MASVALRLQTAGMRFPNDHNVASGQNTAVLPSKDESRKLLFPYHSLKVPHGIFHNIYDIFQPSQNTQETKFNPLFIQDECETAKKVLAQIRRL